MSKESKSPARTQKSAKPAAKKTKRPAAAKTAGTPAAKRPRAVRAKTATAPRPRAPSKTPATTVVAEADVGFGNQLFIRGEGPGLSWDHGLLMECRDSDQWHWSCDGTNQPFAFKVLINDQLWSHGENDLARPGEVNTVRPDF